MIRPPRTFLGWSDKCLSLHVALTGRNGVEKMAGKATDKVGWGDPEFWDDAQEVETDFFRFQNPGDTLVGKLIEKGEKPIQGSPAGHYVFETEDGRHIACHGSMQLDDKMKPVNVGSIVRIEYDGDQKTANGSMKMFSVRERHTADSAG